MKKKNYKILFIVLFSITFLFSIVGIGRVLAAEPNFILTGASIEDKSATTDATITSFSNDSLNTEITYHKVNDFVKLRLTIKNNTSTDYKVKLVSDNNTNGNIEYEYDSYENYEFNAGSTLDVILTATYKNEVVNISERDQDNSFKLTFEFIDEAGNVVDGDVIINPSTYDNIHHYVILLIISLVGLIVAIRYKYKNKLMIIVAITLLVPITVKALSPSFSINFSEELELYDKMVITYEDNGEVKTELIGYDTIPEVPVITVPDGKELAGWYIGDELYNFDTPITQDTELTPKFNLITYHITYDLDGGDALGKIDEYNVETDTFTLVNPTKGGYTFAGWTGSGISEAQQTVTITKGTIGDKNYVAHYTANPYTVAFDGNGSTSGTTTSANCTYGTACTLTTSGFEKTGHTFAGWAETANGEVVYNDEASVTNLVTSGTKTLYAKWTANTYTVAFVGNGSTSGTTTSANCTYGTACTLTSNGFEKTGHTFAGWAETSSGEVAFEDEEVVTNLAESGTKTLYAKWEKEPPLCKKALTLHTERCLRDDNKGCSLANKPLNSTLTYGNISTGEQLAPGDAFNCDVNGDGVYDDATERFYYLRTVDDKAQLIFSSNMAEVDGGVGINNTVNYPIEEAPNYLPTSDLWNNVPEIENGKITRFPSEADLESACSDINNLTTCEFVLENTIYHVNDTSISRSTVWITTDTTTMKRYRGDSMNIQAAGTASAVRPVIEIPLARIDDRKVVSYNPNGGTVTPNAELVEQGKTIENLPTPVREGYLFTGWYDALNGGNKVLDGVVINQSKEFYARWLSTIDIAEIENDDLSVSVGHTAPINITNASSNNEEYEFTSNNTSVATVNENGVITGVSEGNTTITIEGLSSHSTKTVNISVTTEIIYFDITFETNGGDPVEGFKVEENTAIGELPSANKTNSVLVGWYSDSGLTNQVTATTVITKSMTLYAKWRASDTVVEMNGKYYTNLKLAFEDDLQENPDGEKRVAKVLQNFSNNAIATVESTQDIELDLQGYTYTYTGTGSSNVIKNYGTLEIHGGTITSGAGSGMFDNFEGGTITLGSGTYQATANKQVLYNNGGVATILEGAELTSAANERATVHNLNNGVIYIKGGTITSTGSSTKTNQDTPNALRNESGTVEIGEKGGSLSTTTPVLQGNKWGVYGNVYFYDGIIKGKTDAFKTVPTSDYLETGAVIKNGEDGDYKTATLELSTYVITLDPNGGELIETSIEVTPGNSISELPTPEREHYHFDGWYLSPLWGSLITLPHTPTGNEELTAKWTYTPTDEIITFNTTNDVMKEYYSKIDTWKNDRDNFQATMVANFNTYNCQCADNTCTGGTVECDKPKGYETGFNEKVNVYLSSEENKEKGSLVTYSKSDNGVIYNLIPNQVYYWELDSDNSIYGYVKFTYPDDRRILNSGDVRNMRDLGGLPVDTNNDGTIDGHIKYEKLFRGIELKTSSSPDELEELGITQETSVREASKDTFKFKNYKNTEIQNYIISPVQDPSDYARTRAGVKTMMEDVVAGKTIYFHCRIGTDRTGTMAYILEGLLGVPEENRVRDYELSFFYGLINRHRYHETLPGSSVSEDRRFVYMHEELMRTNQEIYEWYMAGTDNEEADIALIEAFRTAMIEAN